MGVDSTKKGDYRGPRTTVSSERSRARGVGWWWKAFDAVATTLASWKRCYAPSRNVLDFRQKKQLHAVRATMQRARPIARGGGGRETGG